MADVDIRDKIKQLKDEKDAVILAHYYVPDEIQEIADHLGDSYYLSKVASEVKERIIVFCGVRFMGESAKIINPDKIVLMPDLNADCPMAHMARVTDIEKMRKEYEDLAVVCYINSTAEIKAHSDVCVTSSNAVKVIKALPNKYIYFVPDENLGRYISCLVQDKEFIFNNGFCHVHAKIRALDILSMKQKYPEAKIAAHPECKKEVLDISDYVGSTAGIVDYIENSDSKDFIVCTETGILHELKRKTANCKNFYLPSMCQVCPDMKMNTLEKVLDALENPNIGHEVKVDKMLIEKGLIPLEKMLSLAAGE